MKVVVALGGNALLKRGEPMTADAQRANVRVAAESLARIAADHQLVISHGNGPQVGLLALEAAAYEEVEAYPFDILGAETQGMIGYLVEQELGNFLPFEIAARDDPDDGRGGPERPGLHEPDEVRRPDLRAGAEAEALASDKGWDREGRWRSLATCRSLPEAETDLRDPADAMARRAWAWSSSAPAAAASRRCTRPARTGDSWASRRSSTRTSPRACCRGSSTQICS